MRQSARSARNALPDSLLRSFLSWLIDASGWWGLLITLLVGGPMGDDHYGDAFRRYYGRLDELGIDDEFVTELRKILREIAAKS